MSLHLRWCSIFKSPPFASVPLTHSPLSHEAIILIKPQDARSNGKMEKREMFMKKGKAGLIPQPFYTNVPFCISISMSHACHLRVFWPGGTWEGVGLLLHVCEHEREEPQ
jgi:hypothetical protein